MAESEEKLKSLLMKVKEETEKAGLKLNNRKAKIMASRPITTWQKDGETKKQWQTLFAWAPKSLQKLTAVMKLKDACSLKEKLYQPRQHINSRDITLPTKVHLVKAMVFSVIMYGCESWTVKKT